MGDNDMARPAGVFVAGRGWQREGVRRGLSERQDGFSMARAAAAAETVGNAKATRTHEVGLKAVEAELNKLVR
jgi:hypothetical protein